MNYGFILKLWYKDTATKTYNNTIMLCSDSSCENEKAYDYARGLVPTAHRRARACLARSTAFFRMPTAMLPDDNQDYRNDHLHPYGFSIFG